MVLESDHMHLHLWTHLAAMCVGWHFSAVNVHGFAGGAGGPIGRKAARHLRHRTRDTALWVAVLLHVSGGYQIYAVHARFQAMVARPPLNTSRWTGKNQVDPVQHHHSGQVDRLLLTSSRTSLSEGLTRTRTLGQSSRYFLQLILSGMAPNVIQGLPSRHV